MIDSPLAARTATASMRPTQLRRHRARARRRSIGIGILWALTTLCIGWLLLAGIAGFAHA
jgi:hypothetical protein